MCFERLRKTVRATLGLLLLASAAPADPADDVAAAHNLTAWWKTDVLVADITLTSGGNVRLQGTMAFETNGPRARMDLASGPYVVHDGETCWKSPADGEFPRARFHVLTWPWFAVAPFKLKGTGTQLTPYEPGTTSRGLELYARQTFGASEGDTPEDWYDIWIDPATDRLGAMGYIVTYGTSLEEANAEPHAIVYGGWETVDGVVIATEWTLHMYDAPVSIGDDVIGTISLENVRFEPAGDRFERPEDSADVPMP